MKKDKETDKYENIGDLGIVDILIQVVVEQVIKDLQPIFDLLPECICDEKK